MTTLCQQGEKYFEPETGIFVLNTRVIAFISNTQVYLSRQLVNAVEYLNDRDVVFQFSDLFIYFQKVFWI